MTRLFIVMGMLALLGACAKGLDLGADGSIHQQVRFTLNDEGPGYNDTISHFLVYQVTNINQADASLSLVWHLQGSSQVREILYGTRPLGLNPPRGAHGFGDNAPPPALVPGRAYLAYAYSASPPPDDAFLYFKINWDGTVALPEQDTQTFSKLVRALAKALNEGRHTRLTAR